MRSRFSGSIMIAIAAAAGSAAIWASVPASAQTPAGSMDAAAALKTPWGEPDLQGIWTDETDTPLQRLAKYKDQAFFTEAQRTDLDNLRAAMLARDGRSERGTAVDVNGAYSSVFLTLKHVGERTSLIVDPSDGRIPPLTPGRPKDRRRRAGISPRTPARHPHLQEQVAALHRRHLRSDAIAAAGRPSAAIQPFAHQSPRRPGGRVPRGALPDGWIA
jgi:hypothetical protein